MAKKTVTKKASVKRPAAKKLAKKSVVSKKSTAAKKVATPAKSYVAFVRDHSGSMRGLASGAIRDYNSLLGSIRGGGVETYVTSVLFGVGQGVVLENLNVPVAQVPNLGSYRAEGMTPMFDGVGAAITELSKITDPNATFLVLTITDGEENASRHWGAPALSRKIRELQGTDKWTFAFRVPRGAKSRLVSVLGLYADNVQEWDQTEYGLQQSSVQTQAAFSGYYAGVKSGLRSSKAFYTDLSNVTKGDLKAAGLKDISTEIVLIRAGVGGQIRDVVEARTGKTYVKGQAFYKLEKREPQVQDYKKIIVKHKKSGVSYGGDAARQVLGLPVVGTVPVIPSDHGDFDIFIQSTSVNRKIPANDTVLFWEAAV